MNIRYNQLAGRFEAEFTTDFQGDYSAVKTAGFKYDSLSRLWHTSKLPVLNKLRENKPVSGLTITPDAYSTYVNLSEIEKVNAEARAKFAPIAEQQKKEKKARKKKQLEEKTRTPLVIPHKPGEDFDYIGPEDLPPVPPFVPRYTIQPHTGPWCHVCAAPLYFYELENLCLWCEKQSEIKNTNT